MKPTKKKPAAKKPGRTTATKARDRGEVAAAFERAVGFATEVA